MSKSHLRATHHEVLEMVIAFWRKAGPRRWFAKNPAFDAGFRARFLDAYHAAGCGEFDAWATTAIGSLALLILLDQFPRNAFRGTARMYETDELARQVADCAILAGHDREVEPSLRLFLYLPFAHSEDPVDQERSVVLNTLLGQDYAAHARGHREIIRRFGRFPHRNGILGRKTTPDEQSFLDAGGLNG